MFVSKFNRLAYQFIEKFDHVKVPAITVIVGQEGLGKTTLLELLYQQNHEKIDGTILIDALKFASKYCYAANNGGLTQFRKFFRNSKLFLLDNINLLRGKQKTIEELFHTLDTLTAQGGKVVLTYKGADFSFVYLGPRFSSRLASGLVIRLNEPTPSEIKEFINYYLDSIAQPDLAELIFKLNPTNLKQVKESVQKILNKQDEEEKNNNFNSPESFAYKNLDMIQAINLVLPLALSYYQVDVKDILGRTKRVDHVQARYMVYLLLHEIFTKDYKEIALYFQKNFRGLQKRCQKIKEQNRESFDTLCQKLYNQLKQNPIE